MSDGQRSKINCSESRKSALRRCNSWDTSGSGLKWCLHGGCGFLRVLFRRLGLWLVWKRPIEATSELQVWTSSQMSAPFVGVFFLVFTVIHIWAKNDSNTGAATQCCFFYGYGNVPGRFAWLSYSLPGKYFLSKYRNGTRRCGRLLPRCCAF